jgi:cellulose synthase/poly-beta-1,6-N-acetylglucosamine synthase-like glycosyltransferase
VEVRILSAAIAATTLQTVLAVIVSLVVVYTVRHYAFTLNRMFGRQRHPYIDIDTADWPRVTVLVAAHNEELVIEGSLRALMAVDYPADRLIVMPVNDRSQDRTREVIDAVAQEFPDRIRPFHRTGGRPGKAAALKDAMPFVRSEVIVVFDADYVPSRGLIRQLVAPLFDPEVGATMGRVVPQNASANMLTRLLDLERAGGYQVDQQARMNLRLVPQYGGTVGAVRVDALHAVGGWREDVLAEDTDLTYRLLLAGWQTVYQNRSECYEEVPETWPVRVRQIMRWTKGHNSALYAYCLRLFRSRHVTWPARLDGLLLLGVYAMSPLLVLGWICSAALLYVAGPPRFLDGVVLLFALMSYSALGNFAAFFEIAAAVRMDGNRNRLRLLPLNLMGFLVSMVSISRATVNQWVDVLLRREMKWDKTVRYRQPGTGS